MSETIDSALEKIERAFGRQSQERCISGTLGCKGETTVWVERKYAGPKQGFKVCGCKFDEADLKMRQRGNR